VFLDYPDSGLAKQCWIEDDTHACSLGNDPYGSLTELYEPQVNIDYEHSGYTLQ